jgi:hypothetical protein
VSKKGAQRFEAFRSEAILTVSAIYPQIWMWPVLGTQTPLTSNHGHPNTWNNSKLPRLPNTLLYLLQCLPL